jgi:hypothetical protein
LSQLLAKWAKLLKAQSKALLTLFRTFPKTLLLLLKLQLKKQKTLRLQPLM